MWQVLLAATIAGSGYFAKQLFHKSDNKPINSSPQNSDLSAEIDNADDKASIFRFSSASNESKNVGKKLKGGIKGKNERKLGSDKKISVDQRKSGKKFAVCLKKRRTGKNASAKCDSFDVKDKPSFGYGVRVGVGIMYMMSAGKVKIDMLNTKVDETAKVVQELKSEICKRKSLCDLKVERIANEKRVGIKMGQSSIENDDIIEDHGFPMSDEGGYASSIITEEPHRDIVEMDQLEAELESELLKLQVSTTETSSCFQNKTSIENLSKSQDIDLDINQSNSVMPSELDQKLCHLLIEQQESQIVDLECELQHTNSKLVEKESELQALKDCVKRLTDFSLTCPTDEEREDQVDEALNKMINGNGRSMVGIKRAIDFD